jgi:NADH-ubiquinone oxidoreductase chain 2
MRGKLHVWFWPGFRYLITLLLLAAGAPLLTIAHFFWNKFLKRDNFTYFCQILLLLSTVGTISMCFNFFEQERFDALEFMVLILLSTCSMLLMISAYDLIAMYLAIELQSLCFYVIAASKRKSEFSTEAGLKYLILGAFSSGILLFGCDWTTTDQPFEKQIYRSLETPSLM